MDCKNCGWHSDNRIRDGGCLFTHYLKNLEKKKAEHLCSSTHSVVVMFPDLKEKARCCSKRGLISRSNTDFYEAKQSTTNGELEKIPQTHAALFQNVLRAAYQAGYIWSQALVPHARLPHPNEWG